MFPRRKPFSTTLTSHSEVGGSLGEIILISHIVHQIALIELANGHSSMSASSLTAEADYFVYCALSMLLK